MKSQGYLRRIYRNNNAKYFHGELPDADIGWDVTLPRNLAAQTKFEETDQLKVSIHLNPDIRQFKEQYRLTLLHEMAHVKLYPYLGHGKKFQEEMMRLAVSGAFLNIW